MIFLKTFDDSLTGLIPSWAIFRCTILLQSRNSLLFIVSVDRSAALLMCMSDL